MCRNNRRIWIYVNKIQEQKIGQEKQKVKKGKFIRMISLYLNINSDKFFFNSFSRELPKWYFKTYTLHMKHIKNVMKGWGIEVT